MKTVGLKTVRKIMCHIILLGSFGNDLSILDIGLSDIDWSDIGMEADVDIGTLPISE
jgi:hypothetical protein